MATIKLYQRYWPTKKLLGAKTFVGVAGVSNASSDSLSSVNAADTPADAPAFAPAVAVAVYG